MKPDSQSKSKQPQFNGILVTHASHALDNSKALIAQVADIYTLKKIQCRLNISRQHLHIYRIALSRYSRVTRNDVHQDCNSRGYAYESIAINVEGEYDNPNQTEATHNDNLKPKYKRHPPGESISYGQPHWYCCDHNDSITYG